MGIVVADALVSDFKLVLKSSAKILKATLSIAPLDIPSYPSLESHTECIRAVAVTPDGRKVVTGSSDYTIKIWDMESGLEIKSLKGHEGCIRAVAITPDGRKIVSGSDDCTLKIWDLESGREIGSLEGHLDDIAAISITSDGRKAVTVSSYHTLRVWDLKEDDAIAVFNGEGFFMTLLLMQVVR